MPSGSYTPVTSADLITEGANLKVPPQTEESELNAAIEITRIDELSGTGFHLLDSRRGGNAQARFMQGMISILKCHGLHGRLIFCRALVTLLIIFGAMLAFVVLLLHGEGDVAFCGVHMCSSANTTSTSCARCPQLASHRNRTSGRQSKFIIDLAIYNPLIFSAQLLDIVLNVDSVTAGSRACGTKSAHDTPFFECRLDSAREEWITARDWSSLAFACTLQPASARISISGFNVTLSSKDGSSAAKRRLESASTSSEKTNATAREDDETSLRRLCATIEARLQILNMPLFPIRTSADVDQLLETVARSSMHAGQQSGWSESWAEFQRDRRMASRDAEGTGARDSPPGGEDKHGETSRSDDGGRWADQEGDDNGGNGGNGGGSNSFGINTRGTGGRSGLPEAYEQENYYTGADVHQDKASHRAPPAHCYQFGDLADSLHGIPLNGVMSGSGGRGSIFISKPVGELAAEAYERPMVSVALCALDATVLVEALLNTASSCVASVSSSLMQAAAHFFTMDSASFLNPGALNGLLGSALAPKRQRAEHGVLSGHADANDNTRQGGTAAKPFADASLHQETKAADYTEPCQTEAEVSASHLQLPLQNEQGSQNGSRLGDFGTGVNTSTTDEMSSIEDPSRNKRLLSAVASRSHSRIRCDDQRARAARRAESLSTLLERVQREARCAPPHVPGRGGQGQGGSAGGLSALFGSGVAGALGGGRGREGAGGLG
eukprot:3397508-Pleurochrysis_carterae.AAC.1